MMKRIAVCVFKYFKLFLMPFLLIAFIGGCLYRICKDCIHALRTI